MQMEPNGSSLKGQMGSKQKKTSGSWKSFRGFKGLAELKEDTFQNDFWFVARVDALFMEPPGACVSHRERNSVCVCVCESQIEDQQDGRVEDANNRFREVCTLEILKSCSQPWGVWGLLMWRLVHQECIETLSGALKKKNKNPDLNLRFMYVGLLIWNLSTKFLITCKMLNQLVDFRLRFLFCL